MKKLYFLGLITLGVSIAFSAITFVPNKEIVNVVTYHGQVARWITPATSWSLNQIQLMCALAAPWLAIALFAPKGNMRFSVK